MSRNRDLAPIEVWACPLTEAKKIRGVLNKFAAEGYAPLTTTFVPTDGGALFFVLGDMTEVGAAAEAEPEEAEVSPDLGEGEPIAASPANGNGNGNGAHTPETTVVEGE